LGTEAFVELLWRVHTQPGKVEVVPGRAYQDYVINPESSLPAESVYLFATEFFPSITRLGYSSFGEVII